MGRTFFCRRRLFCTTGIEAAAEPGARLCLFRWSSSGLPSPSLPDPGSESGTGFDRVIHFILDPLVKPEDDQRNARRVTGGAYIKTTLPARLQARTAGRRGALFAGAAQKGKNPGIYKLTSHLVHSRVFEFFPG